MATRWCPCQFLEIKGGKFKLLLRKINFKNFPNTKLFGKRFPNTKPFGKRFPNGLVFGKFLKLIFLNGLVSKFEKLEYLKI